MAFKVTARTLLQLGSELISSDAIAFYELIKNAFDANSPKVVVRVIIRVPYSVYLESFELLTLLKEAKVSEREHADNIQQIKNNLLSSLQEDAYNIEWIRNHLINSNTIDELLYAIENANYMRWSILDGQFTLQV